MSEFGINTANMLDALRRNSPKFMRRSLRQSAGAVALWNGAVNWLRQPGARRTPEQEIVAPVPQPIETLRHRPYAELQVDFAARGYDPSLTHQIFRRWEQQDVFLNQYDALSRLVREHPHKHVANFLLAQYEMKNRIEEVRSFPWSVMMDLSSVCNVQCRFCKYEHNLVPKVFLPLEHIQRIEWFPYITAFNFSAGTAESIIHPRFNDIFNFIRENYPHLYLQILTNGRSLTEEKINLFKDRLDFLYVSMNASNEEDYNKAIYKGDWDKFSKNMKHHGRILADAKRPRVQANFVMMQWNIERAVDYLEFAVDHGADKVSFCHYYTPYIRDIHGNSEHVLARKFSRDQSLYYAWERSDEIFARVAERAEQLRVEVQLPPPFRSMSKIYFGNRTLGDVPDDCQEPWAEVFLLWGWKSRREEATICCGLASDIGAFFDREEIKSVEGFRAFWNQPILRAYRRTANGNHVNPICDQCRKIDRFDPDAPYPDQKEFFKFAGLPVPPHLVETSGNEKKIIRVERAT